MFKEGTETAPLSNKLAEGIKAAGQLTLVYHYEESYSGHQLISIHTRLVPGKPGTIILDESDEDIGCMPGMLSYGTHSKYEIDVDHLIGLIKEHGKKIE